MATQKKTADVDYSMQEKIIALYELQKIDSKIDEINKVKGELPLEVQDLEDEMTGLKTRIDNINAEIEELNTLTKQRKREVDQAKILIGNYKEQQNNVRNNREFDAITKEIEYQELEIELAEKRLKEYAAGVKAKKLQLEEAEAVADGRAADLAAKKSELEGIEAETAPQVAAYEVQADRAKAKIDERLVSAYGRIRRNVRNGLAVVTVKRDACGGCFYRVFPPPRGGPPPAGMAHPPVWLADGTASGRRWRCPASARGAPHCAFPAFFAGKAGADLDGQSAERDGPAERLSPSDVRKGDPAARIAPAGHRSPCFPGSLRRRADPLWSFLR